MNCITQYEVVVILVIAETITHGQTIILMRDNWLIDKRVIELVEKHMKCKNQEWMIITLPYNMMISGSGIVSCWCVWYLSISQQLMSAIFLIIYCHTMVNANWILELHGAVHNSGVDINGIKVPIIWAINNQNQNLWNRLRCKNNNQIITSHTPNSG